MFVLGVGLNLHPIRTELFPVMPCYLLSNKVVLLKLTKSYYFFKILNMIFKIINNFPIGIFNKIAYNFDVKGVGLLSHERIIFW